MKIVMGAVLLAVCGSASAADKPDTIYTCTREADNGFIVQDVRYTQHEGDRNYILLGEHYDTQKIYFYNTVDDLKRGVYDSSQQSAIKISSSKQIPLIVKYKTASEALEYHCDYDVALSLIAQDDWNKEQERKHRTAGQEAALKKAAAERAAKAKAAAVKAAAATEADNMLSDLNQSKPKAPQPASGGASGAEISQYANTIRTAIQSRLDTSKYAGKRCSLTLHPSRDGTVQAVDHLTGDDNLCNDAMAAVYQIDKFSAPPSDGVYAAFKDATLSLRL